MRNGRMDESLSRIELFYLFKKYRLLNSFLLIYFYECEFVWFYLKVCVVGWEMNIVGIMYRGRYDVMFIFGVSGLKLKFWK